MNPEKLNRWLTLAANIGVVLGIFLLIVEMEANRKVARSEIRTRVASEITDYLMAIAANEHLTDLKNRAEAGEELTKAELQQYELLITVLVRSWENFHYQYRVGMYDKDEFYAQRETWRYLIDHNPYFDEIWCPISSGYSKEFVDEITKIIGANVCADLGFPSPAK